MNAEYRNIINKLFTIPGFDRLFVDGEYDALEQCRHLFKYDEKCSVKSMISELYRFMSDEYRNEYYFKNTLLKKLLFEKHDLEDTSALMELPIADSKADFIIINGKGIVYEIKTDFDNFSRLESQLNDYYKAFRYVYLVVSETNYTKAEKALQNTSVGIYVLKKNNSFVKKRKAKCRTTDLNHEIIFRILRKYEYEEILRKHYGRLPDVTSFKYYKESLKWAKEINVKTFQQDMQECLKRRKLRASQENYSEIPESLMLYAYFSKKLKKCLP